MNLSGVRKIKKLSFVVLFIITCQMLASQEKLKSSVVTGEHFKLTLNFKNDLLAKELLILSEATWPIVCKLFNGPNRPLKKKLEINIYKLYSEYEEVELKLTKGVFKSNFGFSHYKTKSSHIAMRPFCTDKTIQIISCPQMTKITIAHEASHLAIYHQAGSTFKKHPYWFAEGISIWVARKVMFTNKEKDVMESIPYYSARIVSCVNLIKTNSLPKISDILNGNWKKGYAVSDLMFSFLMSQYKLKFLKFMPKVRQMGGGANTEKRINDLLIKMIGVKTLASFDEKFKNHILKYNPSWHEVFRHLGVSGKSWTQIAFNNNNAIAWSSEKLNNRYVAEGNLSFLPQKSRQMNFLLGKDSTGFVSIAINPKKITIFDFQTIGHKWIYKGSFVIPEIQINKRIPFVFTRNGSALSIKINKTQVFTKMLFAKNKLSGFWGVGAQVNSGGIWNSVKITKIKK
ncbi:MAG: hypothetical protein COA79_09655 [Planctomycetota bacterium]|nr:MAG: hypothetical protein COA79_09655 [Planctomycetota bacterium]